MNQLFLLLLVAAFDSAWMAWGCVCLLALICVAQFLFYWRLWGNEVRDLSRVKSSMQELETRLQRTNQELLETAIRNELLREFLGGQSPEEMVRSLQARWSAAAEDSSPLQVIQDAVSRRNELGIVPHLELTDTWQRAEERLVQLLIRAQLDSLTQIANRHTFDIELDREVGLASSTGQRLSLIMLDVDHFKTVNDTYGHQAGDEVLRVFAGILRDAVAQSQPHDRARCARYGGDEFAVILPGLDSDEAARIAKQVRDTVAESLIPWHDRTFQITISVGFATYPQDGQTVSDLIAAADSALLKAKADGRNAVIRYSRSA